MLELCWERVPFFVVAFFVVRFVVGTVLERRFAAYSVDYWKVLGGDIATTAFLLAVTIPAAEWCTDHVPNPGWIVHATVEPWPIVLRVALYIVVADFGHYWMHRILHHPLLWRFHKWHHAPTHMTWLSGNRESFVDRIVVSLPYVWAYPIIHGNTPWWVPVALLCFHAFKNDWMHLNVTFRMRGLERAFVTPHFHHIHHSDNPEHFNKNLGALFSVWDRMFGSYANPDHVRSQLTFGIGEKLPLVRLYTGI